MIGQLLDGRYQVIRALGAGGFGQTYVAQDTRRPGSPICVVKHLKPVSSDTNLLKLAQRLFKSEAEVLEQLGSHSQIPRLLAYFEENQEFYLVQEFIQGNRLTEELLIGKRWNETQVIELLQDVLGILSFLHSKGAIHRDIKPDNIIRRQSDNKLVLVDFGAVKQVRTPMATPQGHVTATIGLGTPGYMPSEQGQGKPRPSSDLYAVGIIGIQAATGLRPYQFEDDPETGEIVWQQHAHVSPELAAILSKLVKSHFKERYATAIEVLQDLRTLAGDSALPESTTPSGRYTSAGSDTSDSIPPTQPVTTSAYAPTQLATSNGYRSSNSSPGNGNETIEQPYSAWQSAPHDQLAGPIPALQDPLPRPTIVTQNQHSRPTKLQSSRTVFVKVVTLFGWSIVIAAVAVEAFFVGRQINPHFFNQLLPNGEEKPTPPSAKKAAPSAKKAAPDTTTPTSVDNPPPLPNPLPSPSNRSNVDILSPDNPSPDNSNSAPAVRHSPAGTPPAASPTADEGASTLAQAQQEAKQGHITDAIATAQTISPSSSTYGESQVAIAKWQDQLSKSTCPSSYSPAASSSDGSGQSGRLEFTNSSNESVSVSLYSPDSPSHVFGTWKVDPGQQLILGQQTYSANWGIQVNCSKISSLGDVSTMTSVQGASTFETSADRIL